MLDFHRKIREGVRIGPRRVRNRKKRGVFKVQQAKHGKAHELSS